ncbi:unnamed protein product [Diplocarpon coronariae]
MTDPGYLGQADLHVKAPSRSALLTYPRDFREAFPSSRRWCHQDLLWCFARNAECTCLEGSSPESRSRRPSTRPAFGARKVLASTEPDSGKGGSDARTVGWLILVPSYVLMLSMPYLIVCRPTMLSRPLGTTLRACPRSSRGSPRKTRPSSRKHWMRVQRRSLSRTARVPGRSRLCWMKCITVGQPVHMSLGILIELDSNPDRQEIFQPVDVYPRHLGNVIVRGGPVQPGDIEPSRVVVIAQIESVQGAENVETKRRNRHGNRQRAVHNSCSWGNWMIGVPADRTHPGGERRFHRTRLYSRSRNHRATSRRRGWMA